MADGGIVEGDVVSILQSEYPKEWMVVSSPSGEGFAGKALQRRVEQLGGKGGMGVEEDGKLLLELLQTRKKPEEKKSTKRWRLLRSAVLRGAASSHMEDAHVFSSHWRPVGGTDGALVFGRGGSALRARVVKERRGEWALERLEEECGLEYGVGEGVLAQVLFPTKRSVSHASLVSHRGEKGVDNTGNVRVWPSEEVLSGVLVGNGKVGKDWSWMEGRRVMELGAGRSGLVGAIAGAMGAARVCCTDGNEDAVGALMRSCQFGIEQLHMHNPDVVMECGLLCWEDTVHEEGADIGRVVDVKSGVEKRLKAYEFDLILCSDCLFFEDFHLALLSTTLSLLESSRSTCSSTKSAEEEAGVIGSVAQNPCALFLQPSRGGSMERFVEKAREWIEGGLGFDVSLWRIGKATNPPTWQRIEESSDSHDPKSGSEPYLVRLIPQRKPESG